MLTCVTPDTNILISLQTPKSTHYKNAQNFTYDMKDKCLYSAYNVKVEFIHIISKCIKEAFSILIVSMSEANNAGLFHDPINFNKEFDRLMCEKVENITKNDTREITRTFLYKILAGINIFKIKKSNPLIIQNLRREFEKQPDIQFNIILKLFKNVEHCRIMKTEGKKYDFNYTRTILNWYHRKNRFFFKNGKFEQGDALISAELLTSITSHNKPNIFITFDRDFYDDLSKIFRKESLVSLVKHMKL
ncbi:MAG: hypothetical protein KJ906_03435 [Nanoarchaeota archaeon]|nr:hypothetical protein [Nanoarchaeota archaeon]